MKSREAKIFLSQSAGRLHYSLYSHRKCKCTTSTSPCCITHRLFKTPTFNREGVKNNIGATDKHPTPFTSMPSVSILGRCYKTKELNTCVHEKEDIWKDVCWSIMKTVWRYSNCCEAVYLYLLDNAMLRWLCALWGQRVEHVGIVLTVLSHKKKRVAGHWLPTSGGYFMIWAIWIWERIRKEQTSAAKGQLRCFHLCLTVLGLLIFKRIKSCMKRGGFLPLFFLQVY